MQGSLGMLEGFFEGSLKDIGLQLTGEEQRRRWDLTTYQEVTAAVSQSRDGVT